MQTPLSTRLQDEGRVTVAGAPPAVLNLAVTLDSEFTGAEHGGALRAASEAAGGGGTQARQPLFPGRRGRGAGGAQGTVDASHLHCMAQTSVPAPMCEGRLDVHLRAGGAQGMRRLDAFSLAWHSHSCELRCVMSFCCASQSCPAPWYHPLLVR
jgi:hypothetical protein